MFFYRYFNVVENSVSLFKSFENAQTQLWEDFLKYSPDFRYETVEEAVRTYKNGYIYGIGAISIISVEDC